MLTFSALATGCGAGSAPEDDVQDRACGLLDRSIVEQVTGTDRYGNTSRLLGETTWTGEPFQAIGDPGAKGAADRAVTGFRCAVTNGTTRLLAIDGRALPDADARAEAENALAERFAGRDGCTTTDDAAIICSTTETTEAGFVLQDYSVVLTVTPRPDTEAPDPEVLRDAAQNVADNVTEYAALAD
ncbi:hypothetical protein GCM10009821_28260 [Aeromicrobium halocynthiae]|uniref:DUF3558 domain-containing protein n=1 Tax=Aeromicrobium halocynthiae TaxID=560557 RepID=A0ABP5HRW3_9ACTN